MLPGQNDGSLFQFLKRTQNFSVAEMFSKYGATECHFITIVSLVLYWHFDSLMNFKKV